MPKEEKKTSVIEYAFRIKDFSDGFQTPANSILGFFKNLFSSLSDVGYYTIFLDRFASSIRHIADSFSKIFDVEENLTFARRILDFSSYVGIATDQMQALDTVTQGVGISLDDVLDALATFNDRVDDFIHNTGYVDDFKGFGFAASDFQGKNALEQYMVFADKIEKMAPERRLAVASRLLGDQINRIFGPLLTDGSGSFTNRLLEVYNSGIILTNQQLNSLKKLKHEMYYTDAILKGMQRSLLASLSPFLIMIQEQIRPAIIDISKEFKFYFGDVFDRFKQIGDLVVVHIKKPMTEIWKKFEGPGNSAVRLIKGLAGTFLLISGTLGMLTLGPLIAAGAAFLAFTIAVEDFIGYLNGEDSMFEDLMQQYPEFEYIVRSVLMGVEQFFMDIKDMGVEAATWFTDPRSFSSLSQVIADGVYFVHILMRTVINVMVYVRYMVRAFAIVRAILTPIIQGFKMVIRALVAFTTLDWGAFVNPGKNGLFTNAAESRQMTWSTRKIGELFFPGGQMFGNPAKMSVVNVTNNLHGLTNPVGAARQLSLPGSTKQTQRP